MRKINLLLALMAFIGSSFAQQALTPSEVGHIKRHVQMPATKAVGDVFWSEDFAKDDWISTVDLGDKGGYLNNEDAMPNDWWIEDNTGGGNKKSQWHWSDVGARGRYTSAAPHVDGVHKLVPNTDHVKDDRWAVGATQKNGFIVLENDFFNTTDLGAGAKAVNLDSYLYVGPIDCSAQKSVIAALNTYFKLCCENEFTIINLDVSNNYDEIDKSGDWTSFQINKLTSITSYTNPEESSVEFNVSKVAALQGSVYFRFYTVRASYYFVMIDDFKLMEGPKDDIIATTGWADYMVEGNGDPFTGGYSQIPIDIVSEFKSFRMAVYNNGENEAGNVKITTEIYKDNALDETLVSDKKNIPAFDNDTVKVLSSYSPNAIGTYQISSTISMTATDEFTDNNSWGYKFQTTNDTYSRVRHGKEAEFSSASPSDWQDGGYDGDMLASYYNFEDGSTATFSGVSVYMYPTERADELEAIENGKFQMKARAFKYDKSLGENGEWSSIDGLQSDLYTVKTTDLGKWIYLPLLDEGVSLQGDGGFLAAIETYTGSTGDLRFEIGSDDYGIKQYNPSTWFASKEGKWAYSDANYTIDLIVNRPLDIRSNELELVSVFPNPFNNTLTLNNLVNVTDVIITNILGQTVMTVNSSEEKIVISTSNLDKGIYLITIVDSNNNTKTERVVKN